MMSRILALIFLCAFILYLTLPNFLHASWLPDTKIRLGLDLSGGAQLLLKVDYDSYLQSQLEEVQKGIKNALRKAQLGYRNFTVKDGKISFWLRDQEELAEVKKVILAFDANLIIDFSECDGIVLKWPEYKLSQLKESLMDKTLQVIRRRIDEFGTKEPSIQLQGSDYVSLQLPGVKQQGELRKLVGQTGQLSFHIVEKIIDSSAASKYKGNKDEFLLPDTKSSNITWVLKKHAPITGNMIVEAKAEFSQDSNPVVAFELNRAGSISFAQVTKANIGRQLAIVLDDKVLSAPTINSEIVGGKGIISGNMDIDEVSRLALLLRAGSLPARLEIVEERLVGATLGLDTVSKGKTAFAAALMCVMLCMVFVYRHLGVIASIALALGMALLLGIIGLVGATLTASGIAGIILTIGMAVDANILVYERIKEEVQKGLSYRRATQRGFQSALSSILDANITTLLAAIILYVFTSGSIKGFALTLGLGILTSMFAAIVITQLLLQLWLDCTLKPTKLTISD